MKEQSRSSTVLPRVFDDLPIFLLQLPTETIQLPENNIRRVLHLFYVDLPEILRPVFFPSFVPLIGDLPYQLNGFHILSK